MSDTDFYDVGHSGGLGGRSEVGPLHVPLAYSDPSDSGDPLMGLRPALNEPVPSDQTVAQADSWPKSIQVIDRLRAGPV